MIRSMETAYFMTRNWTNPPNKIYVFPYLREIDESSQDKYSPYSRTIIDSIPSYRMKNLQEQKQYLLQQGILQYFDFTFVESDLKARSEPGDIPTFNRWLVDKFIPQYSLDPNHHHTNFFIVTHAGVLRDFSHQGHYNNSGFLLNFSLEPVKSKIVYNFFFHLNPTYRIVFSLIIRLLPI